MTAYNCRVTRLLLVSSAVCVFLQPPLTAQSSQARSAAGLDPGIRVATHFPGVDIGAQVNNAFADCARACAVTIPAGTYPEWTTPIVMTKPGQSLVGAGAAITILEYAGTGDAILWQMDPFIPEQADKIGSLTIHGTTKGRSGIHSGSIIGATFEDLHIDGFTAAGSACLWLDNVRGGWMERTQMSRVELGSRPGGGAGCAIGLEMSVHGGTSSFGYNRWTDLKLDANANETGIRSDGAPEKVEFYHSQLSLTCNASAISSTCLALIGDSNWNNNSYDLVGESMAPGELSTCAETSTSVAHEITSGTAISVGSGSRLSGYGLVNFPNMCLMNANGATPYATFRILGGSLASVQDGGNVDNFLGSGVAATAYPTTVAGKDHPYGFGILSGDNIASPYALMYAAGGRNAFIVGTLGYDRPPGAMKEVARIDTGGNVHAQGAFFANGQDYAESVRVTGPHSSYEPGDVLAIDPDRSTGFTKAAEPYSTRVAGIVSAKPGVLGSAHAMGTNEFDDEVPLAITGIVPCKVTAENGPIGRGDLLVNSARPGYAMKGTNRSRMTGAVIGKALEPLGSGTGMINVLITLQ